jgi:hypothetical protein
MIFFSGLGYLVLALFIAPLVVFGAILNWGFGIDVLGTKSSLPLHSLMVLGAILTFVIGWRANRHMVEETTYEKTGPVRVLRPPHTFYWIRMEYWGPILLILYFAVSAYRYFK